MKEFPRVTPVNEVEREPFIGILKDEPFGSLHVPILRLSCHHPSLVS